jgi:transcriptional regulator with XRE-family HTH domain
MQQRIRQQYEYNEEKQIEIDKQVNEFFKNERSRLGLSLEEMGRKLGVSSRNYWRLENCVPINVNKQTMSKLGMKLKMHPVEIFFPDYVVEFIKEKGGEGENENGGENGNV